MLGHAVGVSECARCLQNIFSAETALRQSGLNHTAAVSDFLMVLPPTKKFVMQLEQVDVLEAVFPATVGVVNAA